MLRELSGRHTAGVAAGALWRDKGSETAAGGVARALRLPLFSMISEKVADKKPLSRQYIARHGRHRRRPESG